MKDFSNGATAAPERCLPEADELVLGDDVDGLDVAWSWDEPASSASSPEPLAPAGISKGRDLPAGEAARRQQVDRGVERAIGTASTPMAPPLTAPNALEGQSQQIAHLLEDGQRYRAMHALLNATSMGCIDRALLFKLCALARELALQSESAEAMALAFDEEGVPEGVLLCLLSTRLFCQERQFARADALLDEACRRWPNDARLARRAVFVALRAGDDARAIAGLEQQIERAREAGDRRAAARLIQWLGRLFDARRSDRFRAAECHARAAALYRALALPRETFRAQRRALICLSRIAPPPRQLSGAIRALQATAKAAGCPAEAEAAISALGLAEDQAGRGAPEEAGEVAALQPGMVGPEEIFQRAIEASDPFTGQELPADEQQTKPMRHAELTALLGSAATAAREVAPHQPEDGGAAAETTAATAKADAPTHAALPADQRPPAAPPGQEALCDAAPAAIPTAGRFLAYFLEAEQGKRTHGERQERRGLEQRVEKSPFDAEAYRHLAAYYLRHKREGHARLIADVADALEGLPSERPMSPLTLNDEDWTLFQHPGLGAIAHELGVLVGQAVFQVCAAPIDTLAARGPFSMDGSDGAWALADALLCAVRVLGVRVDDVRLCKSGALPVFPVCSSPPALFVSKPLLKKQLPSALLRFFAGRALASLRPELAMFALVPTAQVEAVLAGIHRALNREGRMSEQTRAVVQRVSGKSADRLAWLLDHLAGQGEGALALACEGARHTANRMGLFTAGGIGPALDALEFEGAGEAARVELLRFAISKAYREFRLRKG